MSTTCLLVNHKIKHNIALSRRIGRTGGVWTLEVDDDFAITLHIFRYKYSYKFRRQLRRLGDMGLTFCRLVLGRWGRVLFEWGCPDYDNGWDGKTIDRSAGSS